eukprot:612275-Prorocentrum_lima.AAC.1
MAGSPCSEAAMVASLVWGHPFQKAVNPSCETQLDKGLRVAHGFSNDGASCSPSCLALIGEPLASSIL